MRNTRLDDEQAGIKTTRNINSVRYTDDTTLMTEKEEELKSRVSLLFLFCVVPAEETLLSLIPLEILCYSPM